MIHIMGEYLSGWPHWFNSVISISLRIPVRVEISAFLGNPNGIILNAEATMLNLM
jgi:hypothetical protein